MKIPTLFTPENNPSKKLEEIFTKKSKKELNKKIYEYESKKSKNKYEYYCDICGNFAGSIEIMPREAIEAANYKTRISCWPGLDIEPSYKNSELVTKSFLCTSTLPRDGRVLKSIVKDLENKNLKAILKKLNGDNLAFYCPSCDKCYCGNHWTTREVGEDCGWYDHTMGTCPKGHERMIDN